MFLLTSKILAGPFAGKLTNSEGAMARKSKRKPPEKRTTPIALRIIGGHYRGRKLKYSGDPGVRPMKDRVREALFNLLGPAIKETYAIDLFGGTGALGLEAISRGATGAHIIEFHQPTARVIEENIATLELQDRTTLKTMSAFDWLDSNPTLPDARWAVFISPPYRYYVEERETMMKMIQTILDRAPRNSLISIEATNEFDFAQLPDAEEWDVRTYSPAVVGVYVCP